MNCAEKLLEPTIHQVTIEFRFRKSLAQERLKSNSECGYQIIVSYLKFRKGFVKFMIQIDIFRIMTAIFQKVEMLYFSVLCFAFVLNCLFVPYGHLLGKGYPLGCRLCCLTVSLSLSNWYPGSGVVFDGIDS